jgi:SAM-dependent methyltransferase
MDEKYWDAKTADYDGQIFSCLANDRNGLIAEYIRKFKANSGTACDLGCGVGKFIPLPAENFKTVHAFDISADLLAQAKTDCGDLPNVSYAKADLAAGVKLSNADFALCVNIAIMQCPKTRACIFKTIEKSLSPGGRAVVVVPSLESALYADFRLVQWNSRSGYSPKEAAWELEESSGIRQGLFDIEGTPTKHYLREEIIAMFEKSSLEVTSIEKVLYDWKSEFEKPPKWMAAPYPWDWLVVLKKS